MILVVLTITPTRDAAETASNTETSKSSAIPKHIEDSLTQGQNPRDLAIDIRNRAAELFGRGEYSSAQILQNQAVAIAEKFLGSEHLDTALALNDLALTQAALAQHTTAIPLQRRVLTILEKQLGKDELETALALSNLALSYAALAQHDQALPLQRRALNILETALGPNEPEVALALNNLAATYSALAQHDEALQHLRRVLKIYEEEHGPKHPDTAVILNNLGLAHAKLAQYDKALPLQRQALFILQEVLGSEHPRTAMALSNLALSHGALGQHEIALTLQTRALNIREKIMGSEHPETAQSLNNIASIYNELALHELALPLQERALSIREKAFGLDHPDTATTLNSLASTHIALAQHDQALSLLRKALDIYEKKLGHEHPDTAIALGNLASIQSELSQHDKALLNQVRALSIVEKSFGPEHPKTALALNNLALSYIALAQYGSALPLQTRALTVQEKVSGPQHPDTAVALINLAYTFGLLNLHDEALVLQKRALDILEKALGLEHPKTAFALNNLAFSYSSQGKHNKALALRIQALAVLEKTQNSEHPNIAFTLSNVAHLVREFGQFDAAINLYKNAVNIYQLQRERVSRISEESLRSYTESISGTYQSFADLLIEQGRLAEAQQVLDMLKEDEVFEFIRRSGNADPRRTRIAFTPTEARWAARYREVADRLASLGVEERQLQQKAKQGLSPTEKTRLNTLKADLEVAEKAFMAFLGDMQQKLSAQGPSKVDEVAATSVDAQRELQKLISDLGSNAVLLQYYVTNDKVGMLLTTPNVVIPFSSEIDAKKLNRDIFDFRRALRDPKSNVLPASQTLYKLLLAPVADALDQAGAETVMLSLDGNLRHIPFGALHDGKQFVAQRWNLPVYTAVTRDKLREGSSTRWRAAGLGVTRAIGEFKALPAVKVEMDGLLRASGGGATQSVVYLDDQFTATKLKEVGQRDFQLMHISSHFSISPGTEVNSFLLLGDGQRLTLGDIRTQNYRFDNVDLLTLSACDTGLGGGRDANGREIEGLGVIAQQQGAKGVLATLWPVADGSTAKLMADMYQRRQSRGLSKIEALRQAQLALMSEPRYSHPFYWAPFILLGNWQ